MTIEELRNFLNELIEENPDVKDKEVRVERWEPDDPWEDEVQVYAPVLDAEYLPDKKILVIEEDF